MALKGNGQNYNILFVTINIEIIEKALTTVTTARDLYK